VVTIHFAKPLFGIGAAAEADADLSLALTGGGNDARCGFRSADPPVPLCSRQSSFDECQGESFNVGGISVCEVPLVA
jgi:hypothetical protein